MRSPEPVCSRGDNAIVNQPAGLPAQRPDWPETKTARAPRKALAARGHPRLPLLRHSRHNPIGFDRPSLCSGGRLPSPQPQASGGWPTASTLSACSGYSYSTLTRFVRTLHCGPNAALPMESRRGVHLYQSYRVGAFRKDRLRNRAGTTVVKTGPRRELPTPARLP